MRIGWEALPLSPKMHLQFLGIPKSDLWEWRKVDVKKNIRLSSKQTVGVDGEGGIHGDILISDLGEQLDVRVWSSKEKSGRR